MSSDLPSYPGDQPAQQPPVNQPPPGQGYGPGAGQPVTIKRPGGVTAASIITMILSALTLVSGLAAAASSGAIADYIRDNPDVLEGVSEADRPDVLDAIDSAMVGFGVFFVVLGIIGIVLGILVLKPRSWARILLTIAAAITALAGVIGSLSLVGLPWLVGSIAVIALLFVGKAGDWFAGRPTS